MIKARKHKAFTLIELLTVVAIIAALIAIFGAGMSKVKVLQKNLQQKAALKAMEVGIELFRSDFEEYPDSDPLGGANGTICGAQRMAEALLGRDEQGYHPRSKWHPDDDIAATGTHPGAAIYTSSTEKDRKDLYVELGDRSVYTIYELWGGAAGAGFGSSTIYTSATATTGTQRAPVITDMFRRNRSELVDKKVGMPVLYFKADPTKDFRIDSSAQVRSPADLATLTSRTYRDWIYDFSDNIQLLMLPLLREPDTDTDPSIPPHYVEDPDDPATNIAGLFYKILTQTERDTDGDGVSDYFKPYNQNTFLLISAGNDGIYGTKDDVTNFNY